MESVHVLRLPKIQRDYGGVEVTVLGQSAYIDTCTIHNVHVPNMYYMYVCACNSKILTQI